MEYGWNTPTLSAEQLQQGLRQASQRYAEQNPFTSTLFGTLKGTVGGGSTAALGNVTGALGLRGMSDALYQNAGQMQNEAAQFIAPQTSYKTVDDLGSAWDFLKANAAQGLGSMLPMVAGRALGGHGLGLAAGYAPMHGENVMRLKNDPLTQAMSDAEMLGYAAPTAAAQTALDYIVPGGFTDKLVRGSSALGRIGAATGVAAGVEGATETGQELLGQGMHTLANPNRDKTGDNEALVQSFLGGAVGGGMLGGTMQGAQEAYAYLNADAKDRKIRQKAVADGNMVDPAETARKIASAREAARAAAAARAAEADANADALNSSLPTDSDESYGKEEAARKPRAEMLKQYLADNLPDLPQAVKAQLDKFDVSTSDGQKALAAEVKNLAERYGLLDTLNDFASKNGLEKLSKQKALTAEAMQARDAFDDLLYSEMNITIPRALETALGDPTKFNKRFNEFLSANQEAFAGKDDLIGRLREIGNGYSRQAEQTAADVVSEDQPYTPAVSDPEVKSGLVSAFVNDALKDTSFDTDKLRTALSSALERLIDGVQSQTMSERDIDTLAKKIYAKLGQRGIDLVDKVIQLGMYDTLNVDNDTFNRFKEASGRTAERSLTSHMVNLFQDGRELLSKSKFKGTNPDDIVRRLVDAFMTRESKASAGFVDPENERKRLDAYAAQASQKWQDLKARAAAAVDPAEKKALELQVKDAFDGLNRLVSARLNVGLGQQATRKDPYEALLSEVIIPKHRDLADKLIRSYVQQTERSLRENGFVGGAGTGKVYEPYDENDHERIQRQAGSGDTAEDDKLDAKRANETGANNQNIVEGPRFYGSLYEGKFADGSQIGAPVAGRDFIKLRERVEKGNIGARVEPITVDEWAQQTAARTGASYNALLNDAFNALIKETEARIRQLSKRDKVLTDAEYAEKVAPELSRLNRVMAAVRAADGDAYRFFNDTKAYPEVEKYRFFQTMPATQRTTELSERGVGFYTTDEQGVEDYVAKEMRRSEQRVRDIQAYGDAVKRSMLPVWKSADGESASKLIDIAGLVNSMIRSNQIGDVIGVGDKAVPDEFLTQLRGAFTHTVATLAMTGYFSNVFARGDTFNTAKIGETYDPNLVIYRNPETNVVTYGQAFGTKGKNAQSAEIKRATDGTLSQAELRLIMKPSSDTVSEGSGRFTAKNALQSDKTGKTHDFNVGELIAVMAARYGLISEDDGQSEVQRRLGSGAKSANMQRVLATPLHSAADRGAYAKSTKRTVFASEAGQVGGTYDGFSKRLTAALLSQGLDMLKRSGYVLNGSLTGAHIGNVALWDTEIGDSAYTMRVRDVADKAAEYSQKPYSVAFDLKSDEIQRQEETVARLEDRLQRTSAQIAQLAGREGGSGNPKLRAAHEQAVKRLAQAEQKSTNRETLLYLERAAQEALVKFQDSKIKPSNSSSEADFVAWKSVRDQLDRAQKKLDELSWGAPIEKSGAITTDEVREKATESEGAAQVEPGQERGKPTVFDKAADGLLGREDERNRQASPNAYDNFAAKPHDEAAREAKAQKASDEFVNLDATIKATQGEIASISEQLAGKLGATKRKKLMDQKDALSAKLRQLRQTKVQEALPPVSNLEGRENLQARQAAAAARTERMAPSGSTATTPAVTPTTMTVEPATEGRSDLSRQRMETHERLGRKTRYGATLADVQRGDAVVTSEGPQMLPTVEEAAAANRAEPTPEVAPEDAATRIAQELGALTDAEGAQRYINRLLQNDDLPDSEDFRAAARNEFGTFNNWPEQVKKFYNDLINGRMGERFSKQQASPGNKARKEDRNNAVADSLRRLADKAKLIIVKALRNNFSGSTTVDDKTAEILMRVSSAAMNIGETTAHENWHAVRKLLEGMGEPGKEILNAVRRAMERPETHHWLMMELMNSGSADSVKDAIDQLSDWEERAAYAFQFYVRNGGKMPVTPRVRGIFGKMWDMMKSLAGVVDEMVTTERFFSYFDTGEFVKNMDNPYAVLNALRESGKERFAQKVGQTLKPLRTLMSMLFEHTSERIKDTGIDAYNQIYELMHNGQNGYAGYMKEQKTRMYSFFNEYTRLLGEVDQTKLTEEQTQALGKFVASVEAYKREAGVTSDGITTLPPVFDVKKIEGRLQEFRRDIEQYSNFRGTPEQVDRLINAILTNGYASVPADLFKGFEDRQGKYTTDDLHRQAFTYIRDATEQAELKRTFGDVSLEDRLAAGDKMATPSERLMMRAFIDAATGRAGQDMNPFMRKIFGAAITAMNASLLPFAVFSQMIEPLQLAYRANDLSKSVGAAFRGFKDLPRTSQTLNSTANQDVWERITAYMGLIGEANTVSIMADLMNDVPMTGMLEKFNKLFFRYIGMEQWTRSMHTAANRIALEKIAEHATRRTAEGDAWMAELGLSAEDVTFMDVKLDDGTDARIPDIDNPAVRAAAIRFVNEAMAHPDAATNTSWMNKPELALVAHLKRFTFGFSYHINTRALNDVMAGKYMALAPLALAVPWMIAVTSLRDAVDPDDEDYKKKWGISDYAAHGIERASLLGRYGLGVDVARNLEYGGSGLETLSPTGEAVAKLARGIHEGNGWATLFEQLPGHQIYGM